MLMPSRRNSVPSGAVATPVGWFKRATEREPSTRLRSLSVTNKDLSRVDGSRSVARLNQPTGVATAPDGTLFLRDGISISRVDQAADTIKEVFINSVWMGDGNLSFGAD